MKPCCDLPLVSICILTFNHENYIEKAIRSCIDQTYGNIEIIVVDNHSSDETVNCIEREFYSEILSGDILLFKLGCNTFPSHGFNYAIDRSKGKYVCLFSGDDFFSDVKVQRQVEIMQEQSLSNLFTWVNIVDDEDEVIDCHELSDIFNRTYTSQEIKEHFVRDGNMLSALSVMLDRKVFLDYGFFDERLIQLQDLDFWVRMSSNEKINVLPEKLSNYRLRGDGGNLSLTQSQARLFRTEFEEVYITKNLLKLDCITLSAATGYSCDESNKYETLLKFYQDNNDQVKVRSVLLALYESLGSKVNFPSDEYAYFFKEYSSISLFDSSVARKPVLKVEELKIKVDHLEGELHLIKSSRVWRITEPLRYFFSRVRDYLSRAQ